MQLPNCPSPASEILEYLSRHPNGQDTIEGIIQWWVLDVCIRDWEPKISGAIAFLVEEGSLLKKTSADGRVLYSTMPRQSAGG